MTYILGLSAYYHDSAAVLLQDGNIIAAVQEERFTRKRHDASFPESSIRFCLNRAGIGMSSIDHVVFYDKPFLKFERLLETHMATAPFGLPAFIKAMPVWLKEKLYLKKLLRDSLSKIADCEIEQLPGLMFSSHHQAHAASAFFASPFEEAVVLCLDGVGEWATTSTWLGEANKLSPMWQIDFPHSVGLLYSAFTYYAGFRVNSGEYKLMGLAPYGEAKYVDLILDNLIDLKDDGTYRLDMSYFNFASGLTMTSNKFHRLFGEKPRKSETEIRQFDMDIAKSIQVVTEEIVLRLARTLRKETGIKNICLAGGVALNCVANGRLLKDEIFDGIWVQPAAGDAGGALGAAYLVWYEYLQKPRVPAQQDSMSGALLGSEYSDQTIEDALISVDAVYTQYESETLLDETSALLSDDKVLGWFQGRMEYGPRALGSRSILADPRSETMQSLINIKIKNRESFRPFAPAVLLEKVADWFDIKVESPYMLLVAHLKDNKCVTNDLDINSVATGLDKLKVIRSQVPAVTHVDNSARVQTVSENSNTLFYHLLKKFENISQCPILINTSFNVRGEPIVESPLDAIRCFMKTDMDVLAIGSFLLLKKDQSRAMMEKVTAESKPEKNHGEIIVASVKQLRQFAITTGLVVAFLFAWFIPWLTDSGTNYEVLLYALLWILWGQILPKTLAPVFRGWMHFGLLMSKIMTPLILSLLYFLLIMPIGFFMKIFIKDPLSRKFEKNTQSYRIDSQEIEPENLEKPF